MKKTKGKILKNGYIFNFHDRMRIVPFAAIDSYEEISGMNSACNTISDISYTLHTKHLIFSGMIEKEFEDQFIEFKEAYYNWLDK